MAKWLIIAGVVLILAGLAWPWLSRLGIGQLPGDIYIERKGFSFFSDYDQYCRLAAVVGTILDFQEMNRARPGLDQGANR